MAVLTWDDTGEHFYETGVDHGVLYVPDETGAYNTGFAWNGLVSVTETPSGAEANAQFADNIKYLNLFSAEEFGATIEAFTYPDEFAPFDGLGLPLDDADAVIPGITIGQQPRKVFGLSFRTIKGNDVEGNSLGYKIHLIYGCSASPSEKAYTTVSDSPEAITFSWEVTTVPTSVTDFAPTSIIVVDSTTADPAGLTSLQTALYGAVATEPLLPSPDAVIAMFA